MSRTVFLADPHKAVRLGLKYALEESGQYKITGESTNLSASSELEKIRPDLIITEYRLSSVNAPEAIRLAKLSIPNTRFIVYAQYGDKRSLCESVRAGAQGYFIKNDNLDQLQRGLTDVFNHKEGLYVDSSLSHHLASLINSESTFTELTSSQSTILRLAAEGKPNKVIADTMKRSIKTVEKHRQDLMDTLGIHDVAGLTRYAIRHGYISADYSDVN